MTMDRSAELLRLSEQVTQVRIDLTETKAEVKALIRGAVATREATVAKDMASNYRMQSDEQRIAQIEHKLGDMGYQIKLVWASIGDIKERLKTVEVNAGSLKRLEWIPIAGLGYALITHTPLSEVLKIIR